MTKASIAGKYRNISATTLTRDNGAVFAPGTTAELTEKEVARFHRAGKNAGAPYIHKVAASPSAGGDE